MADAGKFEESSFVRCVNASELLGVGDTIESRDSIALLRESTAPRNSSDDVPCFEDLSISPFPTVREIK